MEIRNFVNNIKASVAPEVALDKANIMYPDAESISIFRVLPRRFQAHEHLIGAYKVAPMAKGRPRKTGMVWVSFL